MNDFAVVIPCLNEEGYIGACLESLINQDANGITIEVIVVDGMSSDKTRSIVGEYLIRDKRIRLIDNPNKVTPIALNLGIKASNAKVVAILGAHAKVADDFIVRNMSALQLQSEAVCVGGLIENIHENEAARIVSLAMKSPFGVGNARFRTGGKPGFVDTVAFGAYRREIFEQVGYFDERLVRNQDDELNYRITAEGGKIWFDPAIKSMYFVRGSYSKLARQYRQYGYWKVFVGKIHRTVTTWRQAVPMLFVLFLVGGAVLSLFSSWLFGLWLSGIFLWLLGAAMAAWRSKEFVADVVPLMRTFFILHFNYGWGYLHGIIDFLIRGLEPDSQNPDITR